MSVSVTSDRAGLPGDASPYVRPGSLPLTPERSTVVVVPHVGRMLRTRTVQAIEFAGLPVEYWPIARGTKGDYARYLVEWWERGRPFIICEQDIVPPNRALQALADCTAPWCCHAYDVGHGPQFGMLGLSRFSGALLRGLPDLARRALWGRKGRKGWVGWQSVDVALRSDLEAARVLWHPHQPTALHLHHYPDAGPLTDDLVRAHTGSSTRGDGS